MFAFIGLVLATAQGVLVGKVVKRVGERRLIPMAIMSVALGIGLLPIVWNIPTLLGALALLAAGMGFNTPSMTAMVSKLADPDDQGGILGLFSSISSLGRVVGPAWGIPLRRLRHDHAARERGGVDDDCVLRVVHRIAERSSGR
ncbi:MAG: MFS transporter [Hymenobacter sp.]